MGIMERAKSHISVLNEDLKINNKISKKKTKFAINKIWVMIVFFPYLINLIGRVVMYKIDFGIVLRTHFSDFSTVRRF
jgi:uncharacterized membrane protein (DUF106 family)